MVKDLSLIHICNPSLLGLEGYTQKHKEINQIIKITRNNYLKDIRNDLTEEVLLSENKTDNQIIYIMAELQGVMTEIVIDNRYISCLLYTSRCV